MYRDRPRFESLKLPKDTLGPGLPGGVIARLDSPEKQERLDALQTLVERWVAQRLDGLRLTDAERREWRAALEERRREGMDLVTTLEAGSGRRNCAICDGSTRACRRKPAQPAR